MANRNDQLRRFKRHYPPRERFIDRVIRWLARLGGAS